ncbi:terminase TerL endonuclease subunit [Salmonella enterica]|uniref:terminase TerL endonuclease subunit n=1 Tax=Salmonella enterica TaxID=28901 RepID=UPI000AFBAD1A|nr:terminase TerL endonuclease subunit [Salmonella enterica]
MGDNHYYSKYQHEKKRADETVQNAKSATVITNNVLQSLQIVNTVLEANDDVVKPIKEQAENKIDGAVALIMAVGRAMLYEKEDTLSDHIESYGIRSL